MKLIDVKKGDGCLFSEWNLTFRVGWGHILKAAALLRQYMTGTEIFTGDTGVGSEVNAGSEEEIMNIEEAGYLTVRGMSDILNVPVMITFYNQLDLVRVTVISLTDEFKEADYKNFNLSMCQFMDSIELAMYN